MYPVMAEFRCWERLLSKSSHFAAILLCTGAFLSSCLDTWFLVKSNNCFSFCSNRPFNSSTFFNLECSPLIRFSFSSFRSLRRLSIISYYLRCPMACSLFLRRVRS